MKNFKEKWLGPICFSILLILLLTVIMISNNNEEKKDYVEIKKEIKITDPPCLQVYVFTKKHCKKYGIPEEYMFSLLYQETRYSGPFHWNYQTNHVSSVGALGPCQIMLSTARGVNETDSISKTLLLTDIEYNIETACKLIKRLRKRYMWAQTFGYYNSGHPIVNDYAKNILNKQYEWVK